MFGIFDFEETKKRKVRLLGTSDQEAALTGFYKTKESQHCIFEPGLVLQVIGGQQELAPEKWTFSLDLEECERQKSVATAKRCETLL